MTRARFVAVAVIGPLLIALATMASLAVARRAPEGDSGPPAGGAVLALLRNAVEIDLRAGRPRDAHALIDSTSALGSINGGRLYDRAGRRTFESELLRGTIFDDGVLPPQTFGALTLDGAELPATMPGTARRLMPLRSGDGSLLGALEIVSTLEAGSTDTKEQAAAVSEREWLSVLGVAALSSALLLGAGGVLTRSATGPAARAAADPGLQCAEHLARLDELQRSFRRAQEEKARAERKLARAERLANVGQVAAGLAHEVGAPLCVIRGHAERLLARGAGMEDMQKDLVIVAQQIDRITSIVSEVLAFARVPPPRLGPTYLPDVVDRIAALTRARCEDQGVTVVVAPTGDIPHLTADASQVEQVLLNLVTNALDAMPQGGVLTMTVTATSAYDPEGTAKERPHVAITVEDTGEGIPPEHLPRLFEPFFTAKHAPGQSGTGLGLAIAEAIMREHHGWMKVQSIVGKGTRMTAYFPVVPAGPAPSDSGTGVAA